MNIPLQFDRPLFVKVDFTANKRVWKKQEHFPWKELSAPVEKVSQLYLNGYLYHSGKLEVQTRVGDGLEELNTESLLSLVDTINAKVKVKTKTQVEFDRKKCKKSKIADKQRGLIRSWRRTYGQLEND